MYIQLYIVEYKRVRVDWAFHSTEMTVNEMCNVALQARFTVNVTFISQLAIFFRNFSYPCGRNVPVLRQLSDQYK